MGAISALATTFNLPNFLGDIFSISQKQTPFLSMLGGLDAFEVTMSPSFTWQTYDLASAGQNVQVEGAAPTVEGRTRDDVLNVVEIHQKRIEVAYSKAAAVSLLTTDNANWRSSTSNLGSQPVQREMLWQLERALEQIANDVDYSFLRGTFQQPANNSSARQTRGLITAITTNAVSAGTVDLATSHFDSAVAGLADNAAPMREIVIFVNTFQKQQITSLYGYAPESRTVGGVAVDTIWLDFLGPTSVVWDPHVPTDTVLFADMAFCKTRAMPIPGKGVFFMEPKSTSGASDLAQIYGEVGLEYGPEQFHAKITGLTTS